MLVVREMVLNVPNTRRKFAPCLPGPNFSTKALHLAFEVLFVLNAKT